MTNSTAFSLLLLSIPACGGPGTSGGACEGGAACGDNTPPVIENGAPSGILPAGTTSATLSVTTDEPATCRFDLADDVDFLSMTSPFDVTGGTAHSALLTGLVDDGDYSPYVRCIDGAGNANTVGYAVIFGVAPPLDTTPPVISAGAPSGVLPQGTASVSMSVTTDEPATCKWDTIDTGFATMANTFSSTGGTSHQTSLSGLVDNQSYQYYVRCADIAGNADPSSYLVAFSTGVDTVPPVISEGEPSGTLKMGTTTATLSVITDEPATCKWGLSATTAYAALANSSSTNGTSHSTTLSGLADGQSYTRYVRCMDVAGNADASSYVVSFDVSATVDTTPPVISGGTPSGELAAGTTSVVMQVTTDEAATCKWGLSASTGYAGLANVFASTGGNYHKVTLTGLQDGMSYTRYVRCSDTSGNVDTSSYTISFGVGTIKRNYGHYMATAYQDTPADAVALCEAPGVTGINWRQTWGQVETSPGVYDFGSFDKVLAAIAASKNPNCQLWLFIEWKSFAASPIKNPCPKYLQKYSAPNATGSGAMTCFIWEPTVRDAYAKMIAAAGARYDANPRVEGLTFEESSTSLNGAYSQSPPTGTYNAQDYRDSLISLIDSCDTAFPHSRCLSFLNFLDGGQEYLYDVSSALEKLSGNRGCMGGPDLLPGNTTLYLNDDRVYEVLMRHTGCRSNSAQNDSFDDPKCTIGGVPSLQCIFNFAVRGTFGDFNDGVRTPISPRNPASGVCVNSYLFWNNRTSPAPSTGFTVTDALKVVAANPYGPGWYGQCTGGGGAP
jgi:hypothetical protein